MQTHHQHEAMINADKSHSNDRDAIEGMTRGLAQLTQGRVDAGFEPSLVTFMFARLPGNPSAVVGQMRDEATRVFSALITRVVRRPRRSVGSLPIMIAAPDAPVPKCNKNTAGSAQNAGVHMHGVLLLPPRSRLRTNIVEHFRLNDALYRGRSLERIDVRPITHSPQRVVDYLLKGIRRRRFGLDDMLVLPRAISELADK